MKFSNTVRNVISVCFFVACSPDVKQPSQSSPNLINGNAFKKENDLEKMQATEREALSNGVVRIAISMNPCTATYLGSGYFLTAAHCLNGDLDLQKRRSIDILDSESKSLVSDRLTEGRDVLLPDGYTLETKKDVLGREISVTNPDLMVVRAKKGTDLSPLTRLKPVHISFKRNREAPTFLAGYGCTDFLNPSTGGLLGVARVSGTPTLAGSEYSTGWTIVSSA